MAAIDFDRLSPAGGRVRVEPLGVAVALVALAFLALFASWGADPAAWGVERPSLIDAAGWAGLTA
ncbi:hypothetical protein ACFSCV_12090 [Methylopila henanensis]|uniref:Uncharacterized protein n=1 Tax=Methylopila henanensis TaxID=873516 RepID=A0ABW4K8A6_9HYPH